MLIIANIRMDSWKWGGFFRGKALCEKMIRNIVGMFCAVNDLLLSFPRAHSLVPFFCRVEYTPIKP